MKPSGPGAWPGELDNGRYRFVRELGRGGMAAVLLYRDEHLGCEVAVKLPTCEPGEETARRFTAEMRSMGKLRHPHVVTAFYSGQHAGRPYLVMDYWRGHTLAEAMRRSPRPPSAGGCRPSPTPSTSPTPAGSCTGT